MGKVYKTSLMDPPWKEVGGGKIKRGADKHYPVLSKEQIYDVIINSGYWNPDDDAHLYMWVTNNKLKEGLWLMEKLEFEYVTNAVWIKDQMGIGQYFRGKHELLLFGVRGKGFNVRTDLRNIPSVIMAPVPRDSSGKRIHSRKPDQSYELIESRSKGPYIEFFARRKYSDLWDVWGNEAPPNNVSSEKLDLPEAALAKMQELVEAPMKPGERLRAAAKRLDDKMIC